MRRMRTSKAGLDLIKSFEGFRARAAKLPNGLWTIGYAHTQTARENLRITPADAEAVLREYDLPPVEQAVCDAVLAPLNQNEFDALVSFVFNISAEAFNQSLVLEHLNAGEPLSAVEAMSHWRKAYFNGRLSLVDALVRRRATEQALFLKHPAGMAVAPSGFIRPVSDGADFVARAPATEPVQTPVQAPSPVPEKEQAVPERVAQDTARLKRELGTSMPRKSHATEPHPGPTPDEITRAISALANPDMAGAKDLSKAGIADVPPPPFDLFEETDEGALPPLPDVHYGPVDQDEASVETVSSESVIDDLEPAEVDPLLLEKALVDADRGVRPDGLVKSPNSLLHGILGLGGLAIGAFSGFKLQSLLNVPEAIQNADAINFSYGGIVLGIFLVIAAVYLIVRSMR